MTWFTHSDIMAVLGGLGSDKACTVWIISVVVRCNQFLWKAAHQNLASGQNEHAKEKCLFLIIPHRGAES